jgi:hypothetical protein
MSADVFPGGLPATASGTMAPRSVGGTEVSHVTSAIIVLSCRLIAARGNSPRRAVVDIRLPTGIQIHGVGIYERDGQRWASPPGMPVLGPDGRQTTRDGKPAWDTIISFSNTTIKARFSDAVIAAVERDYPRYSPWRQRRER